MRCVWACAVLALCASISGCGVASGGVGSADELDLRPVTQASADPLSGGLDKAALTGREVDRFAVTVTEAAIDQREVRVPWRACVSAAYVLSGTVLGKPKSMVVRQASGEDVMVTVVLAQYEGDQAQSAMEGLAAAVDECADGFTATVDGEERGFKKVALDLAPDGADQAMGLGAVVERAGGKTRGKAVLLRKGNTVAYLSAVPKGRAPRDFAVPAALVDAQLAKLP